MKHLIQLMLDNIKPIIINLSGTFIHLKHYLDDWERDVQIDIHLSVW